MSLNRLDCPHCSLKVWSGRTLQALPACSCLGPTKVDSWEGPVPPWLPGPSPVLCLLPGAPLVSQGTGAG